MKPPCKSAVRTYGTRHIELWCDTCNRMIVLGYKKASTPQTDWEANQAKEWRNHLHTVPLAEKSLKSNVGAIKAGYDVSIGNDVMFRTVDGIQTLGKSSPESVGGVIGEVGK